MADKNNSPGTRLIQTTDGSPHYGMGLIYEDTGTPFYHPGGLGISPKHRDGKKGFLGGGFRRQVWTIAADPVAGGYPLLLDTEGEYAPLSTTFPTGKTLFDLVGADQIWNTTFTHPHRLTEDAGDTEALKDQFMGALLEQVAQIPFEFELLGAQRRYLMFMSPGNYKTQTIYRTLAPHPTSSPFNAEGKISARYRDNYPPAAVEKALADTGRLPIPQAWGRDHAPLLYRGPAWVIKFILDDQDVLENNRVFVTDDARFITSDWCQRHNYTTYGRGIDYQALEWDFATWVNVALTKRCIRDRTFKPKKAAVKHYMVKDLEKASVGTMNTRAVNEAREAWITYQYTGQYELVEREGYVFDPLLLTIKGVKADRVNANMLAPVIPEGTPLDLQLYTTGPGTQSLYHIRYRNRIINNRKTPAKEIDCVELPYILTAGTANEVKILAGQANHELIEGLGAKAQLEIVGKLWTLQVNNVGGKVTPDLYKSQVLAAWTKVFAVNMDNAEMLVPAMVDEDDVEQDDDDDFDDENHEDDEN